MNVKKIFTMVLTVALLLTMATGVFAAGTETTGAAALKLEVTSGIHGTQVAVYLQGGNGVTNGSIALTCKSDDAELLGYEKTDAYTMSSVNGGEKGQVTFAWIGSHLTEERTLLLTLYYRTATENVNPVTFTVVSKGAYAGNSPVEVRADVASLASWMNPFEDISGHWAQEQILAVAKAGLFLGATETTFEPETAMSRAMFVTVLYRMAGSPAATGKDSGFADVAADAYYADAVLWAVENGVTEGVSATEFDPETTITRQEMMTMFYRYASGQADFDADKTADLNVFTDHGDVADWAEAAMAWAVANGIINGYPDGTLLPANEATRAETATIFCRFLGL